MDVTLESAVHNVAKKEVPCNRKAEEYATPNDAPLKEDSLTPPVLGAFMGETLDPANASYEKSARAEPRPDKTLTVIGNPLPTPGDIRHSTLLSARQALPPQALFPSTACTL